MVTEIDGWAPRSPQERAGVWQSPAERGLRKAGRVGHRRGCNRFTGYQASSMDFYYNVSDHLLAFHMCLNLTFFSSRLIGTLSVLDSSAFINACKKTEIAPIACRNMKDINTTECWKECLHRHNFGMEPVRKINLTAFYSYVFFLQTQKISISLIEGFRDTAGNMAGSNKLSARLPAAERFSLPVRLK